MSFIRFALLFTFLLGAGGTAAELLLLAHWEEGLQLVPLVLIALGFLTLAWHMLSSTSRALRIFRWEMALYLLSGAIGAAVHMIGNAEHALREAPLLSGFDLVWPVLTGEAAALAPGAMVILGLIGWLYTYHHPRLARKHSYLAEIPVSHQNTGGDP